MDKNPPNGPFFVCFYCYIQSNNKNQKKGDKNNFNRLLQSINKQKQFKKMKIKYFNIPNIKEINNALKLNNPTIGINK